MTSPFVNRQQELRALRTFEKRSGLVVVYGRRRIGKTRPLTEWLGLAQRHLFAGHE